MAKEEIVVKVDGDIKGLEKAVDKAGDTLGKLGDGADKTGGKLGGLGDRAGNVAKGKLGPLGEAAEMAGVSLDGVGAGGLVAGAALAGLGAAVVGGVQKINEMTTAVRTFKDASGTSWDEASRLTAVLDDLGISTEDVVGGMNQLAGTIDNGDIEKFGIEVVRANDGSTDMAATLGNVADKMNATADPARRAAIGNTLFGDSWVKMMPLLKQGSGGIKEAMAAVEDHRMVTAESEAEQRKMAAATEKLQDALDGLQMSLAGDVIPELARMASEGATVINFVTSLTEKVGGLGNVLKVVEMANPFGLLKNAVQDVSGRIDELRGKTGEAGGAIGAAGVSIAEAGVKAAAAGRETLTLAQAEDEAGEAARTLTAHQKDAAAAAKELGDQAKIQEDKVKSLRDTVYSGVSAHLAFEAAQRSSTAASIELTTKTEELRVARQTYGDGSPQAVEAQRAYESALGGSKEQAAALAQATVNQAREQAIATGLTFTAEQGNIVYRDSLVKVRDATTDPVLQGGLNDLIGLVDTTAATAGEAARQFYEMEAAASRAALVAAGVVDSTGSLRTSADAAERAVSGRAMGGPASGAVLVGERGPEVVNLPQGSRVVPNHAMRSGGGITVNVATNASPWDIAREIDWLMRTGGR